MSQDGAVGLQLNGHPHREAAMRRCVGPSVLALFIAFDCGQGVAGPLVDSREVTSGSLNGLGIGMSSADVLSVLRRTSGKAVVTVVPAISFEISAQNLDDLYKVDGNEGPGTRN